MKKKHPEHVNLERWLVSYADFITLLFAFFVVMYAISQADMAKFKKVSQSLKAAFSAAGPVTMIDIGGQAGGSTVNPLDNTESSAGRIMNLPAGKTHTAADRDPELQELKEKLEESITLELGLSEVSGRPEILYDSHGLIVRLAANGLFDPGEVEGLTDLRPILDRIGRIVSKSRRLVRLEGHTDSEEAKINQYANDWELSAKRAAWVAKYWMGRFNIDPSRLGVAGYGHYRPIGDNTSDWGRARNRRVEIIILNTLYEAP